MEGHKHLKNLRIGGWCSIPKENCDLCNYQKHGG